MNEIKNTNSEIFIASNFREFEELRKKLVEKINKSGDYKAIDLDDNISDPRSPIQRSLEYVQRASYLILLIGDNYGTTPEGEEFSYTHLEYKKALEHNKKILVYTKISLIPENIEKIENEKMRDFLYELRNNHTANEKILSENESIEHVSSEILNHIYHNDKVLSKQKLIIKTKTNIEDKIVKRQNILSRNIELEMSYQFFKNQQKNINSKLLFISGSPGVGKSIFLTDFFNMIDKDEQLNAFIYFIPINTSVSEILNAIYGYLFSFIQDEFNLNGLNVDILNTIHPNLTQSDKINELFNLYSKNVKDSKLKPFILLLDNVDEIEIQEELFKKIILPTFGINFIVSARKNDAVDFFQKQKINNDFFEVYGNMEDNFTLRLSNFDEKYTHDYINNNINPRLKDSKLKNLVLKKSNGLPLYLKYVVDNINKQIEENENLSIEKVIEYLDSLPNELNDYYNQIFNELSDEDLNILNVLYWFNEPIHINELNNYCEYDKLEEFLNKKIFFLLDISHNTYIQISHFSIREALFNKYKINKSILSSYKMTKENIYYWLNNEDYIFNCITIDNNFVNMFSNIYVYSKENILFNKLKEIIIFNLNKKNKDQQFIDLFYRYVQNQIFTDNIRIEKLNQNSKFTDVFENFEITKELTMFVNKFYSYYDLDKIKNYSQMQKIYILSIITKQNYHTAKIFNKMISWKYIRLCDNFLETQDFEIYKQINFSLLKDYMAKKIKLNGIIFGKNIKLYDDGVLTSIVDDDNNLELSLLQNIKRMHQSKKQRQYFDLVQRMNSYIGNSINIKLYEEFKKIIISDINFRERKKDKKFKFRYSVLKDYNLDGIFREFDFKIALLTIKDNTNISPYFPQEIKEILLKLKMIMKIYNEKGLKYILDKNDDYLIYFSYILKEEDFKIYWNYCLEKLENEKLEEVSSILLKFTTNMELLNDIEIYLEKSEKIVFKLTNLMRIYYKTNQIEKFDCLFPQILKESTKNIERSYLMKIPKNFESLNHNDEIIDLYSRYINDTSFIPNSILNIKDIDIYLIFEYLDNLKLNNIQAFNKFLNDCTLKMENINLCKEIISHYEEDYNDEINLHINILLKTDMNMFILEIKKYPLQIQIEYISNNISFILKNCLNNEIQAYEFIKYLNYLIIISGEEEFTIFILEKILNKNYFINFCKKNKEILKLYQEKYKDIENITKLIYILSLIVEGKEDKFIEIFEQSGFKNDLTSSNIIMMFIYNFTNLDYALEFTTKIKNDFLKYRVLFIISIIFKDKQLDSKYYFNNFRKLSTQNRDTETMFENVIKFTLKNFLENEANTELLNTIFFNNSDKDNYSYQKYLSILEYDSIDNGIEINTQNIVDKKSFMTNYLKYFHFEDTSDIKSFTTLENNEIIESLSILFDQYKNAEKNGDEIKYEKYERLFEEIKQILIDSEQFEYFNNLFNKKFERLTLENLFDNFNYLYSDNEEFRTSFILTDYKKFLVYINSIYTDYKDAEQKEDLTKEKECIDKFELIKDEIIKNEKYFNKIISISSIKNKLQIKLSNIDLFNSIEY